MKCGCGAEDCRGTLYAIQHSFAHHDEAPAASPLMQLVWRNRHAAAAAASAFPQLPAPMPASVPAPINVSRQHYEPAHIYARPYSPSPAASLRRRLLRTRRSGASRLAFRATGSA
jgi:hypothetical protein